MLFLSRKRKQRIIIDNDIIVEVSAVQGNKVTLGIECPKNRRIDREEIHIKRKNKVPAMTKKQAY